MSVELKDDSIKVKAALNDAIISWLYHAPTFMIWRTCCPKAKTGTRSKRKAILLFKSVFIRFTYYICLQK